MVTKEDFKPVAYSCWAFALAGKSIRYSEPQTDSVPLLAIGLDIWQVKDLNDAVRKCNDVLFLSVNDLRVAVYFIKEKGDITRWCDWEKRKAALANCYPCLYAAIYHLSEAEETLNSIIEGLDV